ncbi:hypothetical protein J6590_101758, partial [Homalodisca vitripennis]
MLVWEVKVQELLEYCLLVLGHITLTCGVMLAPTSTSYFQIEVNGLVITRHSHLYNNRTNKVKPLTRHTNSPEAGVMSTVTVVTSACNVSSEERSEESIVIHRADFWR